MLAHPNPTIIITTIMIKVITRNAAVAGWSWRRVKNIKWLGKWKWLRLRRCSTANLAPTPLRSQINRSSKTIWNISNWSLYSDEESESDKKMPFLIFCLKELAELGGTSLVDCPTQLTLMTWICQLIRQWGPFLRDSKMFGASLRPGKDIWRRFFLQNIHGVPI